MWDLLIQLKHSIFNYHLFIWISITLIYICRHRLLKPLRQLEFTFASEYSVCEYDQGEDWESWAYKITQTYYVSIMKRYYYEMKYKIYKVESFEFSSTSPQE